jgi:CDP-glucose 4,6-dehydratase
MAENPLIDPAFWRERPVLVTGHTGFVGGWLAVLLCSLGARVHGFALPPDSELSLFTSAGVARDLDSTLGDLREAGAVTALVERAAPELVFHLAAQPLVRRAYYHPVDTFAVNIMGTANLLEALRKTPGLRAAVVMTSDKVYRDCGSAAPHRESDMIGGNEPYSASKAATEHVAEAYRKSYLQQIGAALATVRAGNIIGGSAAAIGEKTG